MTPQPLFPNLSSLSWLIATLILAILPHIYRVAWWIVPTFLILLLWRYLMTRNQWKLPKPRLVFVFALLMLFGILLSYSPTYGRNASIAALVVLCGLKLLEMKSRRDALLLCFLSYFLIITHFLYSQSIPTALYMGLVVLVTTATLISLNDDKNNLSTRQCLRLSGTLLIQALPVMLVLFVLFPRVAGNFWSLPKDAHSGVTGLSDSMSPGDVSELSLSNAIAFRVKFTGAIPPPSQRYWRGPILWRTNGRKWEVGLKYRRRINQLNLHTTSQPYDYTVTLESHNEPWLFALDLPTKAPKQGFITEDYQVLANFPVRQRIRYQLRSYTDYHANILTYKQSRLALQLPRGKHPRARALAAQWQHQKPQAIVQRALQYFNQEPFVYTYTPPLLRDDTVDEFLFQTRQGFCEHYAAAFTVLMRAAGVKARVVTGYLGGTINPVDDYMVVRQRDAHAWSEVWLPSQGWVRVDPTSAIAPERIEQGIDIALPTEFRPLGLNINWDNNSTIAKLFQKLRNRWDALNNTWNQWVLGYNVKRQQEFLSRFGLEGIDWRGMTILLVIIITGLLLSYAAWMLLRSRWVVCDPVQQVYLRFGKKLARHGLQRLPHEGPLTYATRASIARPDLAVAIQQIIELYVQTRYRSQSQLLPQLRLAVRHLRVVRHKVEKGKCKRKPLKGKG